MITIIDFIRNWFLTKEEYFNTFAYNDTRVESWFKAELLVLFEKLKSQSLIKDYEREPKIHIGENRKQIDFKITINGEEHFCELKAMCISQKKETPRNLKFYFRNDDVGLIKDFKKLSRIKNNNVWVLAFIYPKPLAQEWQNALKMLRPKYENWQCLTNISNYPAYFFIALWKNKHM